MKETLTAGQVADRLYADRENAGWSYAGARALADYLEELESDTGEEMELDVVAIRCDFSECESASEAALSYGWNDDENDEDDDKEAAALEYLRDHTQVIEFDGGIIIQDW